MTADEDFAALDLPAMTMAARFTAPPFRNVAQRQADEWLFLFGGLLVRTDDLGRELGRVTLSPPLPDTMNSLGLACTFGE